MLGAMGQLEAVCREAKGPGDVAQLPQSLDEGGRFRTSQRKNKYPIWFDMFGVSAIEKLKAVAEDIGCTLKTAAEVEGAAQKIRVGKWPFITDSLFLCWWYNNMQLPAGMWKDMGMCIKEMAETFNVEVSESDLETKPLEVLKSLDYVAVHVRVENDWQARCRRRIRIYNDTRKWCFQSNEIAAAVGDDEYLAAQRRVLLIHGLNLEPRHQVGTGNHPAEVWKARFPNHHVLDRSISKCGKHFGNRGTGSMIMDLLLGYHSQAFVGHFGSTFTTGITRGHACRAPPSRDARYNADYPRQHHRDYVYSCTPQESLPPGVKSIGNCTGVTGVSGP